MAEEIVSCPGCAKKFRIPEGADPGAFDCTACGASVVYGKAASPGGGGGGGKRGRRGARRAKARRAKAPAGGREGGGRRGEAAAPPAKPESKTPIIVTSIIAVLVIAGLVSMRMLKDDKPKEGANGNGTAPIKIGGLSSEGGEPVTPEDVKPKTPEVVVPVEPDEPSGIGAAEDTSEPKDRPPSYQECYLMSDEELFVRWENLADMTEDERAKIDEQVALMIDPEAGIEGRRAIDVIEDYGRKAVPSLLSTFRGQTWDNENDQRAMHQVQQRLWNIIGADRDAMPSDLFARFNPTQPVPKEHFRRAAKMWAAKWKAEFQYKESFRPFEDEEEEE